ncbi:MAG: DUF3293 domain-containing protein [Bacteroidetes bacterium]|nr:DUF3293 domain-containing protein [Bacteroidota bacterium]
MDDSYKPSDEQLAEWYKNTTYQLYKPDISLRIGQHSPNLDAFLRSKDVTSFVFITAWNPGSVRLSPNENAERQLKLFQELMDAGFHPLPGAGVPDDDSWQEEKSFLVPGMDKESGIHYAKKVEQKAIVYGEIGGEPELIFV